MSILDRIGALFGGERYDLVMLAREQCRQAVAREAADGWDRGRVVYPGPKACDACLAMHRGNTYAERCVDRQCSRSKAHWRQEREAFAGTASTWEEHTGRAERYTFDLPAQVGVHDDGAERDLS